MIYLETSQNGYAVLISVFIVGAIGAVITTSLLLFGIDASRTALSIELSGEARGLADACAEEALQQIHDNTPFTGTENLSFGQGNCSYTVINLGGQNRTITSIGTAETAIRKIKIMITAINPRVVITTWEEVADF